MKLTVQHDHLRSTDELDSLIEERILALQCRLKIEEAIVRLRCREEESHPFSVRVHLVTPGPDLVAESRDHSIRAAIAKVLVELEMSLNERTLNGVRRGRGRHSTPANFGWDSRPSEFMQAALNRESSTPNPKPRTRNPEAGT